MPYGAHPDRAIGDTAERIAKLKKGDALAVTGSLKPSTWPDKTTGEIKHGLNVTAQACLSPYDVKKRRISADAPAASGLVPELGLAQAASNQQSRQCPDDLGDMIPF
ncbi:MAG: hypothetical protein ACRERV_07605 [Methylococcales bacterium]